MTTFQMLWDCSRCGTEKLLGLDHRFCPGCGAPQDPERRYFPEEEDKVAVEDHRFTGADHTCPSCDTANASQATFCVACGGPMDGSQAVETRDSQLSDTAGRFEADSAAAARKEHRDDDEAREEARRQAMGPGAKAAAGGALGLGALAAAGVAIVFFVLCCGFFLWSRDAEFEVTGHSWSRTIEIQAEKLVKKDDWKEDVPRGATDVRCSKKKKDTKKVEDGEECKTRRVDNGDGTFKEKKECKPTFREEPIFGQHCTYRIEEWTRVRTEKASGKALKPAPAWPKVKTGRGERQGPKTETYTVHLREADGTTNTCATAQKRWSDMPVGSSWAGSVGVMTGAVRCEDLSRK